MSNRYISIMFATSLSLICIGGLGTFIAFFEGLTYEMSAPDIIKEMALFFLLGLLGVGSGFAGIINPNWDALIKMKITGALITSAVGLVILCLGFYLIFTIHVSVAYLAIMFFGTGLLLMGCLCYQYNKSI